MEKYTNIQARELFKGKNIISNRDGSIWLCDSAEIYSPHQKEYKEVSDDFIQIKAKYPITRGYGFKKVKFENLEKTEYRREQFSNSFSSARLSAPVFLLTEGIEKIKSPTIGRT